MRFDFERAMLLFLVAEKARQHGRAYQNLLNAADAELREINAGGPSPEDTKPRVVTPPAGPASSELENPDGSVEQINDPQLPLDDRPEEVAEGYDADADIRGVQQPMPNSEDRQQALVRRL